MKLGVSKCGIKHYKKARKEYICDACKQPIRKGEIYFAKIYNALWGYRKLDVVDKRWHLNCIPKEKVMKDCLEFKEE